MTIYQPPFLWRHKFPISSLTKCPVELSSVTAPKPLRLCASSDRNALHCSALRQTQHLMARTEEKKDPPRWTGEPPRRASLLRCELAPCHPSPSAGFHCRRAPQVCGCVCVCVCVCVSRFSKKSEVIQNCFLTLGAREL